MANETYTQCKLRNHSRQLEHIAWIPSSFAQIGTVIKYKDEDGAWNDGWVVMNTFGTQLRQPIEDHERIYLRQRRVSDI